MHRMLLRTGVCPPEEVIQMEGLSEHLNKFNIPTYTLTKREYIGTGLSRILHRGIEHRQPHMALY